MRGDIAYLTDSTKTKTYKNTEVRYTRGGVHACCKPGCGSASHLLDSPALLSLEVPEQIRVPVGGPSGPSWHGPTRPSKPGSLGSR